MSNASGAVGERMKVTSKIIPVAIAAQGMLKECMKGSRVPPKQHQRGKKRLQKAPDAMEAIKDPQSKQDFRSKSFTQEVAMAEPLQRDFSDELEEADDRNESKRQDGVAREQRRHSASEAS